MDVRNRRFVTRVVLSTAIFTSVPIIIYYAFNPSIKNANRALLKANRVEMTSKNYRESFMEVRRLADRNCDGLSTEEWADTRKWMRDRGFIKYDIGEPTKFALDAYLTMHLSNCDSNGEPLDF